MCGSVISVFPFPALVIETGVTLHQVPGRGVSRMVFSVTSDLNLSGGSNVGRGFWSEWDS
jgi:hypothetical protein